MPGGRQLAVDRINFILQNLEAAGSVSVADLSETLGVSRETIRRDLKALAGQGRANLVHGGAAKLHTETLPDEPSLAAREAGARRWTA